MAKKKYPSWFNSFSKPFPPRKPNKTFPSHKELERKTVYTYSSYCITPEDVGFSIDTVDEDEIILVKYEITEKPNPSYEKELVKYKKEYKEYQAQLTLWNSFKEQYDEEESQKLEKREKELLARLKKKYEKKE